MDLGLGHLTELKAHLLNEALRSGTTYDDAIAALGRGVAARFEQVCDRKFSYDAAAEYICRGNLREFVVNRYPLNELASLELRETMADGYVDQGAIDDLVENISEAAGLITLNSQLSTRAASRLRATFSGGFWYATAPAIVIQTGTQALAEGTQAVAVEFDTAFGGVPNVRCSLEVPADAALITATPFDITAAGCTVRLGAATAVAGYTLTWVAVYGAEDPNAAVLQEAAVDIPLGEGALDITFASAFTAAPIVVCQVLTPEGGYLIASAPRADISTTGFRALLGYQVPATGYQLSYIAVSPTAAAAAAAATLPEGATALPADLKYAWLLQCEFIWKLRDKLGLSLAGGSDTTQLVSLTLAGAKLIPDVEEVLRRYTRYAV